MEGSWCHYPKLDFKPEDFDNVGLILGDENVEVKKALITLDTLENVVDEAVENKCDLIISFHPKVRDSYLLVLLLGFLI